MNLRFSPAVFLASFCCAYIVVFANDWPLFRYYPLNGTLNWGVGSLQGAGPAMAWYGLLASASFIATVLAVLIPGTAMDRTLRNRLWLFPLATMLACAFLLRKFFQ